MSGLGLGLGLGSVLPGVGSQAGLLDFLDALHALATVVHASVLECHVPGTPSAWVRVRVSACVRVRVRVRVSVRVSVRVRVPQ